MSRFRIEQLVEMLGRTPEALRYAQIAEAGGKWMVFAENALVKMCREHGIDPNDPDPFLPPRTAEELGVPHGINIGRDHHTGLNVSVSLEELAKGVLLVGSHGSGKTNVIRWLVHQLEEME